MSAITQKKENKKSDAKMGPRESDSRSNETWSRSRNSSMVPELPERDSDRLIQMRHGDESAISESKAERPATADFFEPLDAASGADARRGEGQ